MSESVILKDSGNSKFKAGDLDGAIADWKAAMEANTGNGDTAFLVTCSSNIAMACAKKSDWQNVCKFATDAIDSDAKHVKSLFRRGVAMRHLGRVDEATTDLQRALQLDGSNDDCRKELALCTPKSSKGIFANLGAALGKGNLYNDKPVYVPPPPPPKPGPRQSVNFPYAWMYERC